MGGLFGGGSKKQTVVQQVKLPKWVEEAGQENYERAKELSERPFPKYDEPRIVGFSGDTTEAFNRIRSGGYDWRTPFMEATGLVSSASKSSLPSTDLSQYINPYMDPVINEVVRQGDIARRKIGQSAAQAGAYGSGRHGVLEGEQLRAQSEAIAKTMAGAFENAQRMALADRSSALQGAQLLGQLSGAGQQMDYRDIAALLGIGAQQEARDQAALDQAYQDFLAEYEWPIEMLNLRTSTLGATPYSRSTTGVTTTPGASPLSQALGLGLAGLSIFGGLGGFSGLGSLFGAAPSIGGGGMGALSYMMPNPAGPGFVPMI